MPPVPSDVALPVTPAQFEALVVTNRDLRLERTATGHLIVDPPKGGETGRRNLSITGQLSAWFEANETLGIAFDASTGFELPNGANRSPDAAWGVPRSPDSALGGTTGRGVTEGDRQDCAIIRERKHGNLLFGLSITGLRP